jgi:hypothetical protein
LDTAWRGVDRLPQPSATSSGCIGCFAHGDYTLGAGTLEAELFPTGKIGSDILPLGSINASGDFSLTLPSNAVMAGYAVNDLGSGSSAGTNYFFSSNAPTDNVTCPDGQPGSLVLTSGIKIAVILVRVKTTTDNKKLTQFNGTTQAITRLWASKAGKMQGVCSNFGIQITYNLTLESGWNNVEVAIDDPNNKKTYTSKAPNSTPAWRLGASLETF